MSLMGRSICVGRCPVLKSHAGASWYKWVQVLNQCLSKLILQTPEVQSCEAIGRLYSSQLAHPLLGLVRCRLHGLRARRMAPVASKPHQPLFAGDLDIPAWSRECKCFAHWSNAEQPAHPSRGHLEGTYFLSAQEGLKTALHNRYLADSELPRVFSRLHTAQYFPPPVDPISQNNRSSNWDLDVITLRCCWVSRPICIVARRCCYVLYSHRVI